MDFIKFDTIDSTNVFLKAWAIDKALPDFFYVYTNFQTDGRGQRSNVWDAARGKNMLMSFYLKPNFSIDKQFLLSQIVSISIAELLETFNISDVSIKYPNDILAGQQKISGILIENTIQHKIIKTSVIGIGLNVNQTRFKQLPNATSIKRIIGQNIEIDPLIGKLINTIKKNYLKNAEYIDKQYLEYLFFKGEKNIFITDENTYNGELIGFNPKNESIVVTHKNIHKEIPVRKIKKAAFV